MTKNSLKERIDEYQGGSTHQSDAPDMPDAAADLVDALDTLLLERALEEHRVALARLNELKQALGKD